MLSRVLRNENVSYAWPPNPPIRRLLSRFSLRRGLFIREIFLEQPLVALSSIYRRSTHPRLHADILQRRQYRQSLWWRDLPPRPYYQPTSHPPCDEVSSFHRWLYFGRKTVTYSSSRCKRRAPSERDQIYMRACRAHV